MALASPICRVADCFSVVSCGSCAPQYGQHGKAQPSGNSVLHLVQIFILCYVLEFHFLYNPSEVVSAVFKNIFLLNALSHFEKALRRILSIFEIFRNFRYLQIYSLVNSFVFMRFVPLLEILECVELQILQAFRFLQYVIYIIKDLLPTKCFDVNCA